MSNTAKAFLTSGINVEHLMSRIGEMFSTGTTVLAELLQNARRAKATQVRIDLDAEAKRLVVTDDGTGITDFAKLLTVAESGWPDDVVQSEDPFGIGFASAVFAGEAITVESKGRKIHFTPEQFIGRMRIPEETADFIGGARVTIEGLKVAPERFTHKAKEYAAGFDLPVWLNGGELPRPNARASLTGIEIPGIGFLHHATLHGEVPSLSSVHFRVDAYFQGLPVRINVGHDHLYGRGVSVVLHIDQLTWRPRIPDREVLVDKDEADRAFASAVLAQFKEFIEAESKRLSPEDFAETYWKVAKRLEMLDVMKGIDILPKVALVQIDDYPTWSSHGGNCHDVDFSITRADVEAGKVVLCSSREGTYGEMDNDDDPDGFARMLAANRLGWVMVDNSLPDGHWAKPFVVDLLEASFEVEGEVVKAFGWGGAYEADVEVRRNVALVLNGQRVDPKVCFVVDADGDSGLIIVPEGCDKDADDALMQLGSYEWDDDFNEDRLDEDRIDLNSVVAIELGEAPEVTLQKLLANSNARYNTHIRDRSYLVTVTKDGSFKVTLATVTDEVG